MNKRRHFREIEKAVRQLGGRLEAADDFYSYADDVRFFMHAPKGLLWRATRSPTYLISFGPGHSRRAAAGRAEDVFRMGVIC